MKSLSIIIPHKNDLILLKRLIKSIPNNNSFEIIIIDDHSEEGVKAKLQELSLRNSAIKIFENKTDISSAGKARNIGLEKACGKWILFSDSDDYFLENFETEFQKIENSNEEVIYYRPSVQLNKDSQGYLALQKVFDIYEKTPNNENLLSLKLHMDPPWSKIIRREFIEENQFRFDEVKKHNDTMFSKKIAINSQKVQVVNIPIYHYGVNEESLTKQLDLKSYFSVLDVQSRMIKLVRDSFSTNTLLKTYPEVFYKHYKLLFWGVRDFKSINVFIKSLKIIKRSGVLHWKYSGIFLPIIALYRKKKKFGVRLL